jgi:AbrB family looped-hinge helix DNA binding protein
MKKIITINDRGTITLPKDLREKYGLEAGGKIIIEESEGGLLLHPGVTFSVEIYNDNRLEEFAEQNEAELEEFDFERDL